MTNVRCVSCVSDDATTLDTASMSMVFVQMRQSVTDLRRILGMIQNLSRYLPNLSEVTKPLK